MNTNDIRLIAMDMDGTLLNEEQRISPENVRALRDAAAAGIAIAICSGRPSGDSSVFAVDAGLDHCYIIGLNGGYCLEKPFGKPYAQHQLRPETLEKALHVLGQFDVTYACFQQNRIIVMESPHMTQKKNWATHREREEALEYLYGLPALDRLKAEGINKIVYVEDRDPAQMERIRQLLLPIPGMDVTSSWEDNLELMPSGVNKGFALRELAGKLGLAASQVMALGDYDNDIPMLTYAGFGVAMGNASEAVKRAARYSTGTNAEDGVAQAIDRYALSREHF